MSTSRDTSGSRKEWCSAATGCHSCRFISFTPYTTMTSAEGSWLPRNTHALIPLTNVGPFRTRLGVDINPWSVAAFAGRNQMAILAISGGCWVSSSEHILVSVLGQLNRMPRLNLWDGDTR